MDDGTVLGRAAEIISVVSAADGPVCLAGLARATGIPKPTVRRIANALVARGFLDHDVRGYALGFAMIRHGTRALQQRRLESIARPYVEELHQRCRGSVAWYAVVDRGDATMVAAAHGRLPDRLGVPGWPSFASTGPGFALTVLGRIVLAMDPERADAVIAPGVTPLTPFSVASPHALRALLARAAETRYAEEHEQVRLGVQCAAAPVLNSDGGLAGVIGVTGPTHAPLPGSAIRGSVDALGRDLTRCAATVTR